MNNKIELNAWRNHCLQNQAKVDNDRMKYMYGDNREGLVAVLTIINHLELASIEALREEIKEQKKALETGFDSDGEPSCDDELYPWKDHLVCREGVFIWDWDSDDYVLIREIPRRG
ncbi:MULTISPECIES: hypothetical protein [Paenibacillus]|uniref:Uncharacterized protein n=1 Tax=Paenibacillus urinalis TaxID=521520 RepID=A0AAX3N0G8_9BACL|nr:hypothetical protein [Paenibacillus urinalis]WDH83350.1 hypothetical protein PUW23_03645 [Paenibacillus urinalis]